MILASRISSRVNINFCYRVHKQSKHVKENKRNNKKWRKSALKDGAHTFSRCSSTCRRKASEKAVTHTHMHTFFYGTVGLVSITSTSRELRSQPPSSFLCDSMWTITGLTQYFTHFIWQFMHPWFTFFGLVPIVVAFNNKPTSVWKYKQPLMFQQHPSMSSFPPNLSIFPTFLTFSLFLPPSSSQPQDTLNGIVSS